MNTNYTSIEQSRNLLKLGLNPETADMWYEYDHTIMDFSPVPKIGTHQCTETPMIPCWSFGRLIELMPRYIKWGKKYFELMVIPFYSSVRYYNADTKTCLESKMDTTIMNAAVKMVERLLLCKDTLLKGTTSKIL